MSEVQNNYYAYIVRFRRGGSPLCWRISLLDIHGDQNLHFTQLADFIDFVQRHFSEQEVTTMTRSINEPERGDEQTW